MYKIFKFEEGCVITYYFQQIPKSAWAIFSYSANGLEISFLEKGKSPRGEEIIGLAKRFVIQHIFEPAQILMGGIAEVEKHLANLPGKNKITRAERLHLPKTKTGT